MKKILVLACILLLPFPAQADSLDKIAKKISKVSGRLKNRQIAVLPFPYHDGKEGPGSTVISERLVTKIVSRGKLKVVERSLLEKVLKELKLQHSGVISRESAKKIGSVLGVEAILTGTLIELDDENVEVNARLIQSETGLVLAAAGESAASTWQEPAKKESEPAPAPENGKDKMSAFFHSREWNDPRFAPREETDDRDKPVVLGNRGEPREWRDEGFLTEPPQDMLAGNPESRELQPAWDLMRQKDFPAADRELHRLKDQSFGRRRPRSAALAHLYLAENQLHQGRYEAAIAEARPVLKLPVEPKLKAQALYLIGRSFESLGKPHAAENVYREIVRNYPFESRLIRAAGHRLRKPR